MECTRLLEVVTGTELLRLASLPEREFVDGETNWDGAWVRHPSIPHLLAYADTRPEVLKQYFCIGEAIYVMDGLTYWLSPNEALKEIAILLEGMAR